MARVPQRDILARVRREVERSAKWRHNEGYDELWRRLIDMYAGKMFDAPSNADRVVVNMCFATKNVIAPAISVNNPKFTVMARRPEDAARAVIAEEVVNYEWRVNDYQDEFRLAVDDYLVIGHGWVKVGYKFVVEEKRGEDLSDQEGVDDNEPDRPVTHTNRTVVEDRPFAERVSPFDMFIDPDGRNMRDIRWIAQRIRRPVADVRVDSRYEPSVRKDVQPSARSFYNDYKPSGPLTGSAEADDAEWVDVYEFYDLRRNSMCVFADSGSGFLVKPQPIQFSFGHPFVMIRNYEVPDRFYPIGDLESIEILQRELNETRTQMLNHRKKFARKWLYNEAAFDHRGVAALESDEDNVMVPVLGNENLGNVVMAMPAAITPPDFYNQSQLITNDINMVTGTSDYMRGQLPEIRRTATEAAIIQDASNARAADKLAKIEKSLGRIGKRVLMLLQQFMSTERVVRVVGMSAQPAWIVYDKDYIAGEFDFEVEAGSTQPRNETFRRHAALQLVDAMAPFASAGVIDMRVLARHILQEGFGVKAPESFFVQVAPPVQAPPQVQPGAGLPPASPPAVGGNPELFAQVAAADQMASEIPPELIAQLAGQMGVGLTNL